MRRDRRAHCINLVNVAKPIADIIEFENFVIFFICVSQVKGYYRVARLPCVFPRKIFLRSHDDDITRLLCIGNSIHLEPSVSFLCSSSTFYTATWSRQIKFFGCSRTIYIRQSSTSYAFFLRFSVVIREMIVVQVVVKVVDIRSLLGGITHYIRA